MINFFYCLMVGFCSFDFVMLMSGFVIQDIFVYFGKLI